MMFDYIDYYTPICGRSFKYKPKPTVLHHKTCPICESKRVNIYYSTQLDKYVCKKCMDKLLREKGGGE